AAGLPHTLDDFLWLGQRRRLDPGGSVQLLCQTVRSLPECLRAAAFAGIRLPAFAHGSHAGLAQSDGAGLRARDGPGRQDRVPRAVGTLGTRWRRFHLLIMKPVSLGWADGASAPTRTS